VRLKTASFAVHADVRQSARWKQAAEGEGFPSVGGWLAVAADRHLQAVARSGRPVPLAWRRGSFSVHLDGGELARVKGHLSPPFACFAGTDKGPASYYGGRRHVLVFLASSRPIATLKSFRECKTLASEIAPALIRGELPDPASILKSHL
jgi:hypothetical protein